MRYHKMTAGEHPGTYVVTEPITEQDLLTMANQIARKRLAKGMAITDAKALETRLNSIVGVVTNGLFAHRGADVVLIGTPEGVITN